MQELKKKSAYPVSFITDFDRMAIIYYTLTQKTLSHLSHIVYPSGVKIPEQCNKLVKPPEMRGKSALSIIL